MGISDHVSKVDSREAALARRAPELSIIIVNWHSAEFVRRCVDSIREQTMEPTYEIVVIDNASFDGCDQVLKKHAPEVTYIQCDENLGFAKANNYAFRASRGNGLLFLNPDTEMVGSAIKLLYCALQQLPGVGAVGARLLNSDGSLQTSCIQSFPTILNQTLDSEFFRKRWPESGLWGTEPFLREDDRPAEVEAISGACLMIKREVFERIGGFSEDYFMYAEDMDLCYRIRKAGFKNYYVPQAEVTHFGGGSSRQAPSNFSIVMMRQSIWRFLRNTRGDVYGIGYRISMLLSAVGRLALLSLSLLARRAGHRGKAQGDSFRKWWAILRWSLSGGRPIKRC
jgi:GT2 family glycosyltransferase